jgi:thiol-disulfide isomerase/thioredoxin
VNFVHNFIRNAMQRAQLLFRLIVATVLIGISGYANAQDETSEWNTISTITDLTVRVRALNKFLEQYPESPNAQQARYLRIEAASKLKQADDALKYATEYLNKTTNNINAYNDVAWTWAENEINLDSALVFINRALDGYQQARGRKSPSYLDTKTWVIYKRKDYKSALATQQEAVSVLPKGAEWDPQYSEYYYRLGLCMLKTGAVDSGEQLLARTALFGSTDALDALNQYLKETNVELRLQAIFKRAAKEYLAVAEDPNDAKALVAAGLAKQNILVDDALEYARQAYDAMPLHPSIEQRLDRTIAFGIVNYAKGNYDIAIEQLKSVQHFASPYATDLYLYLGKSYEAIGQMRQAVDVYVLGMLAFQPPVLKERLNKLVPILYGKNDSVDSLIASTVKKLENFEVEPFTRVINNDKVVLAELFTGSECKPCLAADIAYDKLLERFDRTTLAVLEYHLHIPAPDPMTNKDTEERAKYYNVNSTPTSIIDGTEKSLGGGPKLAAKNRFDIFSTAIESKLSTSPMAHIELDGIFQDNGIHVKAKSTIKEGVNSLLTLHVILAEDLVHYRGANTVAEHRYVVRKIIGSPNGITFDNGSASLEEKINIPALTDSLKSYLNEFEAKSPSKKAFKEKKYDIDVSNLHLVAFVQNQDTKEVVQALVKSLGSHKKPDSK